MEVQEAINRLKETMQFYDAECTRDKMCKAAYDRMQELKEVYQMSIEALEIWKPKKPVKDEYGHDCCPTCGYCGIYKDEWGGRYIPHCENCGQAIDWEGIIDDSR